MWTIEIFWEDLKMQQYLRYTTCVHNPQHYKQASGKRPNNSAKCGVNKS